MKQIQKWRYNVIELQCYYVTETEDNMDNILGQFGESGWELAGVYKDKWFIFKQPIRVSDDGLEIVE